MEKLLELLDRTLGGQLDLNIYEIDPNENLFDLGLNSIGFISVIIEIEKAFGIFINQDELDLEQFGTINAIMNYIDKKASSKENIN